MQRRTIAREIHMEGVGLHSGGLITLTVRPSREGIVFVRDGERIPASPENVVDTRLNTAIGRGGVTISTVEHLMSALYGLGITDCEVEVSGAEIPAMDGSALPFYKMLLQAGPQDVPGEAPEICIDRTVAVEDGASWIKACPGPFSITYEIDFSARAVGRQQYCYDGTDYGGRIAPARTFGMLKDVEMMHAAGLARGGSLQNAVVVDDERVLNPEGLRFPDEFIRHKVLDLLGDLWLIGAPPVGVIRAYRASHRLHVALAHELISLYRPRDRRPLR
ncbi:MAG TPA: UDP-3-O-acyl-N-acetylglucosamine deacetylase [Deltaproteobacteria bacterium]|nr:UDP-3-O-acyl-N-acetylglucosamine deacetylase [Deltaproteobacteria bacterium]